MKSKSTLAFLTAGAAAAAAAATAVVTAFTIKRQPSKQPSPRSVFIHPTRTYNRCIGSFNTTTTTTKKNDNTFHILKDPAHPSRDTTSFVSYNLPPGQTYQLSFKLCSSKTNANSNTNTTKTRLLSTGSQTLDIFSTVGSPPTPSRDHHLARVVVREGGAEWVGMGVDNGNAPVFDVRESEPVVLEFVGVGDAVEVCWGDIDVDVDVGFVMRDITS